MYRVSAALAVNRAKRDTSLHYELPLPDLAGKLIIALGRPVEHFHQRDTSLHYETF